MTQIICNGNNIVRYDFDDAVTINILPNKIITPGFDIGDLHLGNCSYYQNMTLPEDYEASKHVYDGVDWTLNPDWIEPVDE